MAPRRSSRPTPTTRSGRQTKITDPMGGTTTTAYDETPGPDQRRRAQPDRLERQHLELRRLQPERRTGRNRKPRRQRRPTSPFDPTSGLPLSNDAPGLAPTTYTYNPGWHDRHHHRPGRPCKITYTYDANGYRASQADAAGDTVVTTSDSSGQTAERDDQSGNETDLRLRRQRQHHVRHGHRHASDRIRDLQRLQRAATESPTPTDSQTLHLRRRRAAHQAPTRTALSRPTATTPTAPSRPRRRRPLRRPTLRRARRADRGRQLREPSSPSPTTTAGRPAHPDQLRTSNQPASRARPAPPTITNAVDAAGLVTSTTTPPGTIAYAYNPDEDAGDGHRPVRARVRLRLRPQGRQNSLTRPNAPATRSLQRHNQPLSLTTTGPGGTTLAKGTNTHRPGQRSDQPDDRPRRPNNYTYNSTAPWPAPLTRAAPACPRSVQYDSSGNRITGPRLHHLDLRHGQPSAVRRDRDVHLERRGRPSHQDRHRDGRQDHVHVERRRGTDQRQRHDRQHGHQHLRPVRPPSQRDERRNHPRTSGTAKPSSRNHRLGPRPTWSPNRQQGTNSAASR